MTLHTLSADEALRRYDGFDAVIDARSESEFALDHLPGALNWPSLNDAERITVGTMYKQVSPFEAQKLGAALVATNIAHHIQTQVLPLPKTWQPLVYCWRGGKRSGSLGHILGQIGFRVHLIEGGYKAFRAAMLVDMPLAVARLRFAVVAGPTGAGKTRLLGALSACGAQVLDLEHLACHRSSVLGQWPGRDQPAQKRFESLVWDSLRRFDPGRPVFVESESRKVGNLAVPESLMTAMRASPCVHLELSLDERVALLLEDYAHFVSDPASFKERLSSLLMLRGHETVKRWHAQIDQGQWGEVVRDLLTSHYDPGYLQSMQRNFVQHESARTVVAADRSMASMRQVAQQLIAETP